MDIKITPAKLSGRVTAPPSKSVAHRMLICAALSEGESTVRNLFPSKDITATIACLSALGAEIEYDGRTALVRGIKNASRRARLDCNESGSTLRFLIPVSCALGTISEFTGAGRLPERPITPYLECLPKHGAGFDYKSTMPFTVSGKLSAGVYEIGGDISSQFITGLLLALPLLDGDSELRLTTPLQSKPYVDITIGALEQFGVKITQNGNDYMVKGGQKFSPCDVTVEGDYSQAAFFEVANALGADIEIQGLLENSYQGDKKIIEICQKVLYNNNGGLKPFSVDAADIPDLVPVLAVLGSFCEGTSYITNAARLRIKESDRLKTTANLINNLGGNVTELSDGLEITGVKKLSGGSADGCNDHRIVMSAAVCAAGLDGEIECSDALSINKSYPEFFNDYNSIGGRANVLDIR